MRLIRLVIVVLLCLFYTSVFSQKISNQTNTLKFKHYSLDDGLSQSSVICILQDSNGFLWFGTRDGLNKFNGHNFITYRYNSRDESSLSNNFIRSLFEDERGNLWIGTMNGLNKYNPEKNNFERYSNENLSVNNINKEIWDIKGDDEHSLWLATNIGLEKINVSKKTTTHFLEEKGDLSDNNTRSLWIQKNGHIWVCNRENIDVLDTKSKTFSKYSYPVTTVKRETGDYAPVIYEDNDGEIWLGYENGLWIFDKLNKSFNRFNINTSQIKSINSEVRSVRQDYLGNLWIGTYTGLYVINRDKTNISLHQHNENNANSLSQNSVYEIFEDSKKDLWVGTFAGGINYYDRNYDLFKSFSSGITELKLNYNVVSSIVEDDEHNLWIGTEGGGLNYFDNKTKLFKYFTNDKDDSNSLSENNVKTILRTEKGNLWIGTHDGGLNFLDLKKKPWSFKKFKNIISDTTSISSNRVISLYEDYKNNIWVGTSGKGLNVYKNNIFYRIKDDSNKIGSIIYRVAKSTDPDILFVCGNKGLVKLNISTYKIDPIQYRSEQANSYNIGPTLDVFEDELHNLWIATQGDGLYYYNSQTAESVKYDMSSGLPNEVIYSVLPDNDNNLWLSTNNGLSRLNLKTLKFDNFNVTDGLIGNEFNYGAYLKLSNENLMFGGAKGVSFFNPKDIIKSSFTPSVSVTSVLVNNKPFVPKDDVVELNYDQNVFSFNFVALDYSGPKKCEYAYKLDGFDSEWNSVGNKRSATYTNLDSGTYFFNVKASNSNGVWNDNEITLKVKILPAPWKTWWAYLIYTFVIVGILLLIRKLSLLRLKEKNQLKQERLEKEKLEEINQLKLQLFTNISHDFRTPLTLIIGPLERMLKSDKVDVYVQQQLQNMHRNANTLLQLMNQLLDFRKSQSGKMQLKATKSNIVPFLREIKYSFEQLAVSRNIDFTFESSREDIEIWFDPINLKKVVYNLLSNAFKFTADEGEISMKLSVVSEGEDDFFKLIIKDNGVGIPAKSINFIFDRFYQVDENENTRSGTGIGLSLTKNLIELHKGSISVESIDRKGCAFTVLIPVGDKHLSENQKIFEAGYDDGNPFYTSSADEKLIQLAQSHISVDENESEVNANETTLLIVEDNKEVRDYIKDIFRSNYSIEEAANGAEALEIANNKKVDLIISDLMMPEMDGMELCENIKSNIATSHIPLILLTAKTSEDTQHEGYKHGADAYILKPFNAEILKIRVANLISARKTLIEKYRKDLILETSEIEVVSEDELFLQKAIDFIEKNIYDQEYSIQDFISDMGVSRSVLYRKLKALTNQTITEFIRVIKLKRARQSIIGTNSSISCIAIELGFNDPKHFRKTYKDLFNELPSQSRANNQSNLKDSPPVE